MTRRLCYLFLSSWFLLSVDSLGTIEMFQKSCQSPIHGYLFCSFSVTKNWDFLKFREWSDSFPGEMKNVELYINCENGASVFLPWPMRARSLQVLDIQGCSIQGFYNEYENPANYTDSIVDLKMADCVIEENLNDHIDRNLNKRPSKSFACGQESVVVMDIKNVTSTFPRIPTGPKVAKYQNVKQKKYSCIYNHMIYYEETLQYSLENDSTFSHYPVLKVATFSSNNLSTVPSKGRDWPSFFPVLEVLDISNNSITDFYFEDPNENRTLYVDMRYNSVVDVPTNMTSYLQEARAVIIDLRHNPIRCGCSVLNFKEYLLEIQTRFPTWYNGTEVYCETQEQKLILITTITMETCTTDK